MSHQRASPLPPRPRPHLSPAGPFGGERAAHVHHLRQQERERETLAQRRRPHHPRGLRVVEEEADHRQQAAPDVTAGTAGAWRQRL